MVGARDRGILLVCRKMYRLKLEKTLVGGGRGGVQSV